jgi:hypothetical protein
MPLTKHQLDQVVKRYILDHVDGSPYDVVTESDAQKIKFLQDAFESEYGWRVKQVGRQQALSDWFAGLPTACTVDFYNYEILELARTWGRLPLESTEAQEQKILDSWFKLVAAKTCQLFDGYRLPKMTQKV